MYGWRTLACYGVSGQVVDYGMGCDGVLAPAPALAIENGMVRRGVARYSNPGKGKENGKGKDTGRDEMR